MGCGKSKHDVVMGNTTNVRKPSEPESVKGKESESIKRQESCRCRKKNEISIVVSGDQPETTVENDTKKPEEKLEDGGDCGGKMAVEMKNDDIKPEETETTTTLVVLENIVTEETVKDVQENVAFIDELKGVNMETVIEEEKSLEDNKDSKFPSPDVEEPKLDEQIPATESEVHELPAIENEEIAKEDDETAALENEEITKENDETAATGNDEIAAVENDEIAAVENDEIAVVESEEIEVVGNVEIAVAENDEIAVAENDETTVAENEEITKENYEKTTIENKETPVIEDNVAVDAPVDAVKESPVDVAKEHELA